MGKPVNLQVECVDRSQGGQSTPRTSTCQSPKPVMCTLPAEGGVKVADGVRAAYQLTRLSPRVQGAQLTVSSQWGHRGAWDMQENDPPTIAWWLR